MSKMVAKSHNKSLMLYHLVCPAKYRRDTFTPEVTQTLKEVCKGISQRYEIHFIEIGTDEDHVHFLIQSVPMMQPSSMVRKIKSITAKEIFKRHKEVKTKLWGGEFWTKGYFINTVGQYGNEKTITEYVKNQGQQYEQIYSAQPTLFEGVV